MIVLICEKNGSMRKIECTFVICFVEDQVPKLNLYDNNGVTTSFVETVEFDSVEQIRD